MFSMPEVKQSLPVESTRLSARSNILGLMEDVSDRIKKLRKELRLTQEGLGAAAKVTKQAVSQWERGLTSPERDALLRLMESHKVNPEWVSSGNGEMFTPGTAADSALPAKVTRLTPPPDPLLAELLAHAGRMAPAGLARLVERAASLAEQYPAQANPAKSSG